MPLIDILQAANAPQSRGERIYGVVVGIVRDLKDPDGLGRVKVDFPWMGEDAEAVAAGSDEDRAHSYWARIATPMAGKQRGIYAIPEVDEEVLVAFEHGDPDRPFVLGGLWNREDVPPVSMDSDGKNHVRAIHTRSGHIVSFDDNTDDKTAKVTIQSQGGHSLVLDDADDKGKIEIKTSAGHVLTLDDDGGTITLEDSGGGKLVLDANAGSLTVNCSGNADQKVGGNLTIDVTGTATIKAPSGVTIDSTSIKLGSSAALTLVNDTFLDLFNAHFHVGNMGAPTSPPTVPAIKNVQSTMFTKGA